jgi:chromosome segregation ATPase
MEYEIHGGSHTINGDIERLEAHGGVLYVKGKVGTLVHHGGVMYDQRPSNRVEYRRDKISEEERQIFRQRIAELERRLNQNESECLKLREKLGKQEMETPPDDVLIAKIKHLQGELESERADRKREVEELNERIDVALEINAKLRHKSGRELISQNIADRHVDILASLMALYPFTPDKDLVLEFNIPVDRIREVARVLGVIKSKEARQEAVEYLRKQHIEFIQRRGGDQNKWKKKK